MSEPTVTIPMSLIAGWEELLRNQQAETDKYFRLYTNLLKEQIKRQLEAMEEFSR